MISIDIATLFPDMCEAVLNCSILGRARKAGLVSIETHDIRDFTLDKHRRVDDSPYGGGRGMLIQADPIFRCYKHVCDMRAGRKVNVIYLSPQGTTLTQSKALELSKLDVSLFLICGHYEGIDQRVIDEIVDEEVSIGKYVVSGGELPALVFLDSILRTIPGVLSSNSCFENESYYNNTLEHPQYTRPQIWHGKKVPEVLLSGDHKKISEYREKERLRITKENRPDLLDD